MKIQFAEPDAPTLFNQEAGWYAAYDPCDNTIVAMFWDRHDAEVWALKDGCEYPVRKVIFPDE